MRRKFVRSESPAEMWYAAVRDDYTSAKGKRQLIVGIYDSAIRVSCARTSEKQPLQFYASAQLSSRATMQMQM